MSDALPSTDQLNRQRRSYFETRFAYDPSKHDVWRAVVRYLEAKFRVASPVLDAGAGYGYAASAFSTRPVTAVDRDPEVLQRTAPNVDARVGDIRDLDLETDAFGTVLISNVLEHLSTPDIQTGLSELYRVLAPDGECVVVSPNIALAGGRYWDDYTHVTGLTVPSLRDLLEVAGFDVTHVERRFLPFSADGVGEWPGLYWLTRAYLAVPPRLRPRAGQSLLVAEVPS